jgi:hypothetical protein
MMTHPLPVAHLSGALLGALKRESSRACRPADFPAPSSFTCCTVRCHEDVQRHIYGLFQALGIQYRWVLSSSRQRTWPSTTPKKNHGCRRTNTNAIFLKTPYTAVLCLWSEFSHTYAVFDQHGPAQLLCTQKVWEALLTAFPLKHKSIQAVLLAREIGRLMAWDRDSKNAVNIHFGQVGDIHSVFEYMGALTIDDVFRSIILATLKSSTIRTLRTAYDQILDDLDDDKDPTFAHIQTVCARQFLSTKVTRRDSILVTNHSNFLQ